MNYVKSLTLIFLLVSFIFLYSHEKEMHQHITREAFQLLKLSFPVGFTGLDEMETYLGYDETTEDGYCPSIGREFIVAGAWMEDEYDIVHHYGCYEIPNYNDIPSWVEALLFGDNNKNRKAHSTITHFWNADNGENASIHLTDTIYGDLGQSTWEFTIPQNALKKIKKYANGNYIERRVYPNGVWFIDVSPPVQIIYSDWNLPGIEDTYHELGEQECVGYFTIWGDYIEANLGLSLENNGTERAYNRLGRMCHLLQDMSVPAHVHCTAHPCTNGMHCDYFENHELDYLENYNDWNAEEVYNTYGGMIYPYLHDDPLYYLMYFLNQITDHYADGKHNGDNNYDTDIPGLSSIIPLLGAPTHYSQINEGNCKSMYDVLIPYAIRTTAGLLYWFAVETEQIDNIEITVTGNVSLNGGSGTVTNSTVTFIPHNSGSNIVVSPNSDGTYSHSFNYQDIGYYDIVYELYDSNGDYYPKILEDIHIYIESPIILPNIILNPIVSTSQIFVSNFGNGFYCLSEAINYSWENGGGIITLLPGTYSGSNNGELHWNPFNFNLGVQGDEVHIKIQGIDKETCIIDASDSEYTFLFDDEGLQGIGYGQGYTNDDIIENLTIRNARQGIIIENGSPIIRNCIIEDCEVISLSYSVGDVYGVGIECNSSAIIDGNIIRNNIGNWQADETYGGGISIINNTDSPTYVINNEISNCAAAYGGGIYCNGTGEIIIEDNTIDDNFLLEQNGQSTFFGHSFGIFAEECDNLYLKGNLLIDYNDPIHEREVIRVSNSNNAVIINNTIADNPNAIGMLISGNDQCSISNNIIINNLRGLKRLSGEPSETTYSVIYNNSIENLNGIIAGEGCFSVDPRLNQNGQPIWDSDEISPCIDTGDPSIFDEDGTLSDIGAIPAVYHDYHECELSDTKVRWVSFPNLDRFNVDEGMNTDYVFDPLTSVLDHCLIINEGYRSTWNGYQWDPHQIQILDSKKGYKVDIDGDFTLPVIGFNQSPSTVIQLDKSYPQENWIGYFIEEPIGIRDAFDDIWDKIINIKSEDWEFASIGGIPHERCTLIYGKMYVVKVSEPCEFVYGGSGGGITPKERTITETFPYEETYDYCSVIIDSLNDPQIQEVGLFLDEQCIGSTLVEEYPLQLLAFVPEVNRGNGSYSFKFYTGERKLIEKNRYKVYDERIGQYVEKNLELDPEVMTYVSFDENEIIYPFKLMPNYPNPFNPETTIQYSVSQDTPVELTIYNIKGQKVKTLVNEIQTKGTHEIVWDGKDETNNSVSNGIYLYKLSAESKTDIRKMTLLK